MAYTKTAIRNIVIKLHKVLNEADPINFPLEPPFQIRNAIEMLGGTIEEDSFLSNIFAGGEVCPIEPFIERKFLIKLPKFEDYNPRLNFTLAHELGHIILHFKLPLIDEWINYCEQAKNEGSLESLSMFRLGRNRFEYEANHFAACFLMPEESIREYCINIFNQHSDISIEEIVETLCNIFDVSYQAMEIRLKHLGLY